MVINYDVLINTKKFKMGYFITNKSQYVPFMLCLLYTITQMFGTKLNHDIYYIVSKL